MRVDLFDFDLPEERIALRPADPRGSAKMLIVGEPGEPVLQDAKVSDLGRFLKAGDALVFNDTKVIAAQLEALRWRDNVQASVSLTLHMRLDAARWKAFARPAKKLKEGDLLRFLNKSTQNTHSLEAFVEARKDAEVTLRFSKSDAALQEAIAQIGQVPLPPYISAKRPEDDKDRTDYQTVYARQSGAVAAPTAGLHFTTAQLHAFQEQGVAQHFVTLHVGAGTFLPVKADDTDAHVMHQEIGFISPETASALNLVRQRGGRIVAIGTTSLRLLESATDENGTIHPFSGATGIFMTPGYSFRAADLLVTNFHLPRSTLFMLVCAFSGLKTMHAAYQYAIDRHYRFYSYGDTSLLFREE